MRARLKRPGLDDLLGPLMPLLATLLVPVLGGVMLLLLGVNALADTGVKAPPSLVPAFANGYDLFADAVYNGVGDITTSVVSCLGDSITNGYPYAGTENTYPARLLVMLEAAHGSGSFDVINHGVDGHRADQVLADLQDLNWMAEDPDFVLLMVGGNDLAQGQGIGETVAEVQEIVDLVTAHINANGFHPQIIVSAFPPNRISGAGGSLVVAFYNSSLESNLTGIDLWITDNWDDLYDPDTGQARESLMYDTVHPNADGYALIAENWFEAIDSLLPTPTPTPTLTPTATGTPSPTATPDNYNLYLPLSWKNY